MNFLKTYTFLFLVLLTSSCSHMKYDASSRVPTYVSYVEGENKRLVKIEFKEETFLWGLVNSGGKIKFGKSFADFDIVNSSSVRIRQFQTFKDQTLMYLSLGIYIPYTIEVFSLVTKRDVL